MKAKEINQILKNIHDKDTTTKEEKKALLNACECVWDSRMDKVVDIDSFMHMLYEHMGVQYDIDVNTTETETIFIVKTFKKV